MSCCFPYSERYPAPRSVLFLNQDSADLQSVPTINIKFTIVNLFILPRRCLLNFMGTDCKSALSGAGDLRFLKNMKYEIKEEFNSWHY